MPNGAWKPASGPEPSAKPLTLRSPARSARTGAGAFPPPPAQAARGSVDTKRKRIKTSVGYSLCNEGPRQAGLLRGVLEREAVPDLLGEGLLRGDGAARASAAHGRAPLRRVRGRARVLRQAARRADVAQQGVLRHAD